MMAELAPDENGGGARTRGAARIAALGALALTGALATGWVGVRPAAAAVTVSAFHVSPSSTTAGAHSDVTITTAFSYDAGSDTLRDVAVTLPPGLVGNPNVATHCAADAFASDACPATSHVGIVTVGAALLGLPLDILSSGDVYALQPAGPEPARLGIIVRPLLGLAKISLAAPVNLNPADGSLTTSFTNLPQTLNGLSVRIDSMTLTLQGLVNGNAAFLTNPTSCKRATSTVSADSYGAPAAASSGSDAFTPTDCAALPFDPHVVAGISTTGGAGDAVALTTVITQAPGEANISTLSVTLPNGLSSRQSTLNAACAASAVAAGSCPPGAHVGSISADTPLLNGPLSGPVVLQANPGSLPLLIAQLSNGSVHLRLTDATGLSPDFALTNTFTGIPDVPVSKQTLIIDGGANSLLVVGHCNGTQQLTATITSQSGRSVTMTAPVQVCAPGTKKVKLHSKTKRHRHRSHHSQGSGKKHKRPAKHPHH